MTDRAECRHVKTLNPTGLCALLLQLVLVHSAAASDNWRYPEALGEFRLVTRAVYPEPSLGVVGRYSGAAAQRQLLDIFTYPVPGAWRALDAERVLRAHFEQLLEEIVDMGRESGGRVITVLERGSTTLSDGETARWARLSDQRGAQVFDGVLVLTVRDAHFVKLRASQRGPLATDEVIGLLQTWLEDQQTRSTADTPRPVASPAP